MMRGKTAMRLMSRVRLGGRFKIGWSFACAALCFCLPAAVGLVVY
jgi:hypothetical protein